MTKERRSPTTRRSPNYDLVEAALDRRLLLYAVAAATLGCSASSQAEVVFTPSNSVLQGTGKLGIDLDNDGTIDITIRVGHCDSASGYQKVGCITAYGAPGIAGIAAAKPGFDLALALPKGARIGGRKRVFRPEAFMATGFGYIGHWARVPNRFLGISFRINGETHFGWIGFRSVYGTNALTAKFAGWAYETNPDTLILAGDTGTGSDDITSSMEPTSLEILASGHTAVEQRRKRTSTEGNLNDK
jgi:hypothetical protein